MQSENLKIKRTAKSSSKRKFKNRVSEFIIILVVDHQTYKVDQEICDKYGLSIDELGEMLTLCEKEPEIKEMQDLIDENTIRIFDGKRPDFKLEYPDKITSELYFEILTTIFEFVRYETYTRLRYKIRVNSGSKSSSSLIFLIISLEIPNLLVYYRTLTLRLCL